MSAAENGPTFKKKDVIGCVYVYLGGTRIQSKAKYVCTNLHPWKR